jgi:hypothetical protein
MPEGRRAGGQRSHLGHILIHLSTIDRGCHHHGERVANSVNGIEPEVLLGQVQVATRPVFILQALFESDSTVMDAYSSVARGRIPPQELQP